jgi:hypothetical protein
MAGENRIKKFFADAQGEKRRREEQTEHDAECVMVIVPHVAKIIEEGRKNGWDDDKLAGRIAILVYRSMTNLVKWREDQSDGR